MRLTIPALAILLSAPTASFAQSSTPNTTSLYQPEATIKETTGALTITSGEYIGFDQSSSFHWSGYSFAEPKLTTQTIVVYMNAWRISGIKMTSETYTIELAPVASAEAGL